MKINALLCLALVLLASATTEAKKAKEDKSRIVGIEYLDSNFKTYDKIQKDIHDYAEPGYLEFNSSKELAEHLQAAGFKVEMGVADIPTAFVATFGSGSPVIGFLGEYDALPGMSQDSTATYSPLKEGAAGHACGHNLLGTAPAAAAVAVSKWLSQGHQGTIKYFGCPAEEGGGGKAYMTNAGCFNGCDAILDWHPTGGRSNVTMSTGLANVRVNFNFRGKAAHASSSPWSGKSALDAVEAFNYMMNLMREHLRPEARIHYYISNGGQAPNIVPEYAQVVYYFRAQKADYVFEMFDRALQAAKGAAMGTGTQMTYELVNGNYECRNNLALSEIYLKNLQKVGGIKLDDREKAYINQLRESSEQKPSDNFSSFESVPDAVTPPSEGGGSTDVGNVTQVAPVARMYYPTCINAGGHSWQQASIAGTTIGTKAVINVGKIMYLTALDLFTDSTALAKVREEFDATHSKDFVFKPLMGDRKPPLDMNK